MAVQNFLEDEEYADGEGEESGSFVPNFLDEEDYDSPDDEYYGGGFSDSVQSSSVKPGYVGSSSDGVNDYDDSEADDLFDGSFDFMSDDEVDFEGDTTVGSGASYSISGLNRGAHVVSKPTASKLEEGVVSREESVEARSDGSPSTTNDSKSTNVDVSKTEALVHNDGEVVSSEPKVKRRRDLSNKPSSVHRESNTNVASSGSLASTSSVPNFLDEEEYDSPISSDVTNDKEGGVSLSSNNPSVTNVGKSRRDLSKKPKSVDSSSASRSNTDALYRDGGNDSSRVKGATKQSSEEGLSSYSKAKTGGGAKTFSDSDTVVGGSSSVASSGVSVPFSFGSKLSDEALNDAEAVRLKSPSNNTPLKFTALKQPDSVVRRVGSDGMTSTERARMEKAKLKSSIRLPENGKLSSEELLFYANLGATKSSDVSSKKKLVLPPVLGESLKDRREREALINRSLPGGSIVRGSKTRLTEKDYMVLQFIALFKFVSERQVGKLLQVGEHSAYKRLNSLRKHGLTKAFKTLGIKGSVWVLTDTGMDLSGFELPRGTEASLTLSMVSHQFTVNHVAAHLWSGGANVLRENSFPQKNRLSLNGEMVLGENIVSELQIQSAFGKVRGSNKAEAFVPQIKKEMASQFDRWERLGGVGFGPSPELVKGNEYMWTLFPPISNRLSYHVPDLVVARPRAADGSPQSIAVEVELKTKADDSSYEKTLDAYRMDESTYRKVVWVCRLRGTAEKLMRIAKKNGLMAQKRFAIVPIYLESGKMFTGKDTWSL